MKRVLRQQRLRWQLYGLLPRCSTSPLDGDWGYHCWGLIWPWQEQEGPMHARCRARAAESREAHL